ncbi:acetate kinase [Lysinibacillus sp. 2017]|uniref:phosphate propanoyltransferase n=1 Tax=unclassified Lysinibacillus TaxID=2636778 RepID=UPI000D52627B|nr:MULTISPECIES: phosphate propanoyltransferase [unclassified Lysinibacillus]AWE07236.1 acetate kinase [Lysinibacillus sp. 2017]TGN34694.1 phosphate propanoyltransferase [Lysinibacillus sp. S2017]
MNDQLISSIVDEVLAKIHGAHYNSPGKFSIGISARHVHLSEEHVHLLFGEGYELKPKSPLSQPGQFAAEEQVTIVGNKGSIHQVRVLGPARKLTQVEVSATDARQLGIQVPLRFSGDTAGSAPITIVGPKGSIYLQEGCIIAAAHIHMSVEDAHSFGVTDGQFVNVRVLSQRPLIFNHVKIRVSERFKLEMHVDTDEGNAAMISVNDVGEIVTDEPVQQMPMLQPTPSYTQTHANSIPTGFNKKLVTEKDVADWTGTEMVVNPKTIITALAYDQARKRGIKIVRQK